MLLLMCETHYYRTHHLICYHQVAIHFALCSASLHVRGEEQAKMRGVPMEFHIWVKTPHGGSPAAEPGNAHESCFSLQSSSLNVVKFS